MQIRAKLWYGPRMWFPDLPTAMKELPQLCPNPQDKWIYRSYVQPLNPRHVQWFDGDNVRIDNSVILRMVENLPKPKAHRWRRSGFKRRGHHNWLARPWTQQERRENAFVEYDEDCIEYNIKSRRLDLPTAWDDSRKGSYGRRNWKHFRRTQYK